MILEDESLDLFNIEIILSRIQEITTSVLTIQSRKTHTSDIKPKTKFHIPFIYFICKNCQEIYKINDKALL